MQKWSWFRLFFDLGIIRFTQAVKMYEKQDEEIQQLNHTLKTCLIPTVTVIPGGRQQHNGSWSTPSRNCAISRQLCVLKTSRMKFDFYDERVIQVLNYYDYMNCGGGGSSSVIKMVFCLEIRNFRVQILQWFYAWYEYLIKRAYKTSM